MATDDRPPVADRLQALGATSLGEDPSPDAVEAVLRRWASTMDGADPIRVQVERDALVALPGLSARAVDAALRARGPGSREPDLGDQDRGDPKELLEAGREILEAPDQLDQYRDSLQALGFAGSTEAAELAHLALSSRALERPLGLAFRGPSAAGKSFTVETAARHHPDDAMHDISAMSERYLAYAEFPTEHRYVCIAEASALHNDGVGATIIRELSWNRRLRYGTVVRSEDGPQAVTIERPGPTGLITTSTRDLDPEIATRLIAVHITDAPEQTRKVMERLAATAAGRTAPDADLSAWHAASDWLVTAGNRKVVVPYAPAVADGVPAESVRMRRDFEQVMTVVRAHAFMHQLTRPRNDAGHVVATRDDYAAAHRLLAETMAVTLDRVSDTIRETVEAVERLAETKGPGKGVSYPELAAELEMSRSGANRRGQKALQEGYLANTEERDGYPARLVPADPLPAARAVLPDPKDIPPSEDPPKRTHGLTPPEESPATAGETPVRPPDSYPGGCDAQGGGVCDPPRTPSTARNGGEKSEGCEGVRPIQGGAGEGVSRPDPERDPEAFERWAIQHETGVAE